MNAYATTSSKDLLTPDVPAAVSTERRPPAVVDALRTWRLARELVAYDPTELFVVAPPAHESAGLRVIDAHRSVDICLAFDGSVSMHRPWREPLDVGADTLRSLGTTRLAAARIARASHLRRARHRHRHEASPTTALTDGVVDYLTKSPRGSVFTAQGWVVDGAGLRCDTPSGAKWLTGSVPLPKYGAGPLPELPASAWFWLGVDRQRHVVEWWSQRPMPPTEGEPAVIDVTATAGGTPGQDPSETTQRADRGYAA